MLILLILRLYWELSLYVQYADSLNGRVSLHTLIPLANWTIKGNKTPIKRIVLESKWEMCKGSCEKQVHVSLLFIRILLLSVHSYVSVPVDR
jgi:hypothetical protein